MRVLLIIGGGVAAFKALELARLLMKRGVAVQGVLTDAGARFVTPLSLGALTGEPVHEGLWSLTDEARMGHIELSRSADLIVVAPATADLMGKAANGLADDLASTLLLATDTPVLMAPAMNVRMWEHPAVRRNRATLAADGVLFVGPDEGAMACGEYGPGRLAEPEAIADAVMAQLGGGRPAPLELPAEGPLSGRHLLVTAGPTAEPLDPVRVLTNRSSGKQGYAIAGALARLGARVTLVSGPVALPAPAGVERRMVETAQQMLDACRAALPADAAVCVAAVSDWQAELPAPQKLKKGPDRAPPTLRLRPTPDILADLSTAGPARPRLVVGFAAETENLESYARAKLQTKGCDWIVANDVGGEGADSVMGGEDNAITLFTSTGAEPWPRQSKAAVAEALAHRIAEALTVRGRA